MVIVIVTSESHFLSWSWKSGKKKIRGEMNRLGTHWEGGKLGSWVPVLAPGALRGPTQASEEESCLVGVATFEFLSTERCCEMKPTAIGSIWGSKRKTSKQTKGVSLWYLLPPCRLADPKREPTDRAAAGFVLSPPPHHSVE